MTSDDNPRKKRKKTKLRYYPNFKRRSKKNLDLYVGLNFVSSLPQCDIQLRIKKEKQSKTKTEVPPKYQKKRRGGGGVKRTRTI